MPHRGRDAINEFNCSGCFLMGFIIVLAIIIAALLR